MSSLSLHQLLVLYSWFPLAALLLFLLLIARFYQKMSGRRTFYWLFSIPLVGFGAAAVRYASIDAAEGDALAATAMALSGGVLAALVLHLQHIMLRRPHHP